MLKDDNGDGKADDVQMVASRPGMHGIAFDGKTVFLVAVNDAFTAEVNDDGTFGPLKRIINDLPDAGQHANRTIAIGPDGMLYITVGSTCNECQESNPENATILRAKKDGSSRTILPAACATPSASIGSRRPEPSTASITGSIGSATRLRSKRSTASSKESGMAGRTSSA